MRKQLNLTPSRNGWGASAIDALSTALIMRQADIVHAILTYIPTIDFSTTNTTVSLFETTIRYLGGLLSAYDLAIGPLSHIIAEEDAHLVPELLHQAVNLANALSFAFETPSGVPWNDLDFSSRGPSDGGERNGLATIGTLILEWTHLSDLTGNATYAALVEKAESHLLHPRPASSEPFPGLVGTDISTATGEFLDARGGWGGGTDSFYEYLLKMWIYDSGRYGVMLERWHLAANSTITYLASHPDPRPDLTFLTLYSGREVDATSSHLAGFAGGNFILGGLKLDSQRLIDFGLQLTGSWRETYTATATRIGPEKFTWNASLVTPSQLSFFNQHGFVITNSEYILRPEVIESYYHAYRATLDPKYQDWAWEAFVAINSTCRVGSGFSSVLDVNDKRGGGFDDFQESFWFAEVLKYLILVFDDGEEGEGEWQVGGTMGKRDAWVFNTEAHPLRVRKGYGERRR